MKQDDQRIVSNFCKIVKIPDIDVNLMQVISYIMRFFLVKLIQK
jgi:hypothetical protein